MPLTPTERDRLLLFTAAELARTRLGRGLRLNVPEATALIADTVGTGLLFVTHDLDLAAAISDRVYVMYAGRIVESAPRRPSSRSLGTPTRPRCSPPPRAWKPLRAGLPPSTVNRPTCGRSCTAARSPPAARCPLATEVCDEQAPEPLPAPGPVNHQAACHHTDRLEGSPVDA